MSHRVLRNADTAKSGFRHSLSILAVIVGLAAKAALAPAQPAKAAQETWYVYRIAGKDIGRIHETVHRTEQVVITSVDTLIIFNRLGSKVEIKGTDKFTESIDGQLRGAHSEMSSSRQTTTLEASVVRDKVLLRVSTGGKEYRRQVPFFGKLVGPWMTRQASARELKTVGDVVIAQTFVPQLERVADITRKLVEANAPLSALGTKLVCTRVEERMDGFPGVRNTWLDADGRMLRQTQSSPFGVTEVVVTDRATAIRAGGGILSDDMFAQTLLHANVRLPAPRSLTRLVVRLRQKDADLGWPNFSAAGQTVLRRDGKELLLEVRQINAEGAVNRPIQPTSNLREFMEPNVMLQSDDEEVQRIARQVVGDTKDAFRAACRLRDWVTCNMQMDLGIALAPASEAIRQRKGTCAAYSITLASLARAAGIPSQVVMGYVYVAGIWGGHAWVEVWTGNRWVPLDGALPSPGSSDAARIACVRTSLADGVGPLTSALSRFFGNVEVAIAEFEVAGVHTAVPDGSPAFRIEGNIYRNPWLGLEIKKPAGYHFAKTDAIYPDSTVVAIDDPAGQRVCLRQLAATAEDEEETFAAVFRRLDFAGKPHREKLAGRHAFIIEDASKAGLALSGGLDGWVLTAEGDHAGQLIRRAAAMVTIGPRQQ